jgi:hypothetical protein
VTLPLALIFGVRLAELLLHRCLRDHRCRRRCWSICSTIILIVPSPHPVPVQRSAEIRPSLRRCFLGMLVLGSTLDQLSPKLRQIEEVAISSADEAVRARSFRSMTMPTIAASF